MYDAGSIIGWAVVALVVLAFIGRGIFGRRPPDQKD